MQGRKTGGRQPGTVNRLTRSCREAIEFQEGVMAKTNFPFSLDRRQLLATGIAITASAILPGREPANSGVVPYLAEPSQLTFEAAPTNVSPATARRLAEIARRNEIRKEANLPLLPIAKELRRMKKQEELKQFERFEAAYGKAVWDEVLKVRRETEGPNWRPRTWMEGVGYRTRVRKVLWEQFTAHQAGFDGPASPPTNLNLS